MGQTFFYLKDPDTVNTWGGKQFHIHGSSTGSETLRRPKKKPNKSHRVKGYDGYCDSSGYIHMRTLILNAKYLKLRNKSVYY